MHLRGNCTVRLWLRLLGNDWAGPALISLVAVIVISILQPSFLTPFNILVLLSAVAVNMVIALGQLVIIGVGQMNLALGTLGGLVGVCFVGAIEVLGVPVPLAILLGLLLGALAGIANGYIISRTGCSTARLLYLTFRRLILMRSSGPNRFPPLKRAVCRLLGIQQWRFLPGSTRR